VLSNSESEGVGWASGGTEFDLKSPAQPAVAFLNRDQLDVESPIGDLWLVVISSRGALEADEVGDDKLLCRKVGRLASGAGVMTGRGCRLLVVVG
jgi:hypothetical protein